MVQRSAKQIYALLSHISGSSPIRRMSRQEWSMRSDSAVPRYRQQMDYQAVMQSDNGLGTNKRTKDGQGRRIRGVIAKESHETQQLDSGFSLYVLFGDGSESLRRPQLRPPDRATVQWLPLHAPRAQRGRAFVQADGIRRQGEGRQS